MLLLTLHYLVSVACVPFCFFFWLVCYNFAHFPEGKCHSLDAEMIFSDCLPLRSLICFHVCMCLCVCVLMCGCACVCGQVCAFGSSPVRYSVTSEQWLVVITFEKISAIIFFKSFFSRESNLAHICYATDLGFIFIFIFTLLFPLSIICVIQSLYFQDY